LGFKREEKAFVNKNKFSLSQKVYTERKNPDPIQKKNPEIERDCLAKAGLELSGEALLCWGFIHNITRSKTKKDCFPNFCGVHLEEEDQVIP
jgi:hypothetical protein